jgi:glycosyltransferase involved in cell wall biosynthesis
MGEADPERLRALLYVHRLAVPNPTGVHRYVVELAEALSRQPEEFEIDLCSGRTRQPLPAVDATLSHPRAPRRTLHLAWTLLHRPIIERLTKPTDVVHMLLPAVPVAAAAPQVITIHDLLPLQHPEWYGTIARVTFERSIAFYRDHAAAIITPSQAVADDVVQTLGVPQERITVIPEGVDSRFQSAVDEVASAEACARFGVTPEKYVVTVGALTPRKNLEVVFTALAHLEQTTKEAPVLVVVGGDGPFAEATREAAKASKAEHLIRFVGRLPDAELHHLVTRARAMVHPSKYEGFGLTPLEAIAMGTPPIASRAGAVPEVVGDAGILVDPDDPEAWAQAIEQIMSDDALHAGLREEGRRHIAAFTWAEAARRTLEVYRGVVRRTSVTPPRSSRADKSES